jgi:hypothetical protein
MSYCHDKYALNNIAFASNFCNELLLCLKKGFSLTLYEVLFMPEPVRVTSKVRKLVASQNWNYAYFIATTHRTFGNCFICHGAQTNCVSEGLIIFLL